jgi:hypothetical protein
MATLLSPHPRAQKDGMAGPYGRPTLEEVAAFVREWAQLSAKKKASPETQFERDPGITGEDGDDLLLATETRFRVSLHSEEHTLRQTFNLAPNEYLFHSEDYGVPFEILSLFSMPTVRAFTSGALRSSANGDQPAARKEEYLWLKGNRH